MTQTMSTEAFSVNYNVADGDASVDASSRAIPTTLVSAVKCANVDCSETASNVQHTKPYVHESEYNNTFETTDGGSSVNSCYKGSYLDQEQTPNIQNISSPIGIANPVHVMKHHARKPNYPPQYHEHHQQQYQNMNPTVVPRGAQQYHPNHQHRQPQLPLQPRHLRGQPYFTLDAPDHHRLQHRQAVPQPRFRYHDKHGYPIYPPNTECGPPPDVDDGLPARRRRGPAATPNEQQQEPSDSWLHSQAASGAVSKHRSKQRSQLQSFEQIPCSVSSSGPYSSSPYNIPVQHPSALSSVNYYQSSEEEEQN